MTARCRLVRFFPNGLAEPLQGKSWARVHQNPVPGPALELEVRFFFSAEAVTEVQSQRGVKVCGKWREMFSEISPSPCPSVGDLRTAQKYIRRLAAVSPERPDSTAMGHAVHGVPLQKASETLEPYVPLAQNQGSRLGAWKCPSSSPPTPPPPPNSPRSGVHSPSSKAHS